MRRSNLFVSVGLGLLLSTVSMAGSLYRWVDDDGKVHYGDRPPPQQQTEELELKYLGKGEQNADDAAAKDAESAGPDPVLDLVEPGSSLRLQPSPQRCAAAKQRLQLYSQARRLERPDQYGQQQIVSDAERQKYIAGAREEVDRACAGQ